MAEPTDQPDLPQEAPEAQRPPEMATSEPLDLDEAAAVLADNGIDGPDLPYNPRALAAMRTADALLAELARARAEIERLTTGLTLVGWMTPEAFIAWKPTEALPLPEFSRRVFAERTPGGEQKTAHPAASADIRTEETP